MHDPSPTKSIQRRAMRLAAEKRDAICLCCSEPLPDRRNHYCDHCQDQIDLIEHRRAACR